MRMLQELTAHGYSNPVIGERVRQRLNGWRSLLEEIAATHLPRLGISVPGVVASAVFSLWLGMETQHLAGATEEEGASSRSWRRLAIGWSSANVRSESPQRRTGVSEQRRTRRE